MRESRKRITQRAGVIACSAAVCLLSGAACAPSSHKDTAAVLPRVDVVLAPTSANFTPGADFYDEAGRRWICNGLAKKLPTHDPEGAMERAMPMLGARPPVDPMKMTVAELAEALRPVRLVDNKWEYRLAEPDMLVAERILNMPKPPPTPSRPPVDSNEPGRGLEAATTSPGGVKPQFVFYDPYDARYFVSWTVFTASAIGHVAPPSCTFTMIGPSTALTVAHCFYTPNTNGSGGGWSPTDPLELGANNWGPANTDYVLPHGAYYADTLTIPGGWAYSYNVAPEWDFAVLEFSPSRYPGNTTGYFGTRWDMSGQQWQAGYPLDKLRRSLWATSAYYDMQEGAEYRHYMDVELGQSGSCVHTIDPFGQWVCTGVQNRHWWDGTNANTKRNYARRWDSTTYNFFDAYGNWP